jgi:transposase-like protein
LGLSLRDLQEVMSATLGDVVALSVCNRLVWEGEAPVKARKNATIAVPPAVVMVDGIWGRIASPTGEHQEEAPGRWRAVKRHAQRVGVSALGLWDDGHGAILPWQIASGANQATWQHVLGELSRKGVTEQTTQWVGREGSTGLESALDSHCYGVPHQRCILHTITKVSDYLVGEAWGIHGAQGDTTAERQARQARKQAIFAEASAVYARHDAAEIREQAARFRARWAVQEPEAIAAFFVGFDKTLSSLQVDLPDALLPVVRTTNLLERLHREARRKQRDIGMLQSERGCDVLWYLMAMRETAKQIALAECRLWKFAK